MADDASLPATLAPPRSLGDAAGGEVALRQASRTRNERASPKKKAADTNLAPREHSHDVPGNTLAPANSCTDVPGRTLAPP